MPMTDGALRLNALKVDALARRRIVRPVHAEQEAIERHQSRPDQLRSTPRNVATHCAPLAARVDTVDANCDSQGAQTLDGHHERRVMSKISLRIARSPHVREGRRHPVTGSYNFAQRGL